MNAGKNNKKNKQDMLVVGLGASAGGLDPLKQFFKSLPEETGMAFIVVMHLSAEYDSKLAEILQDSTSLTVRQVQDKTRIKPEHVYVTPPNKVLIVEDGHIGVTEPDQNQHKPATVDLLFRSLGKQYGRNSACIILSGTGTDGSVGIKSMKENEGLTIAQAPEEAEFSDMPEKAISRGLVDMVLPVARMAEELMKYKEIQPQIQIEGDNEEALQKIFSLLHSQTGHDFSNYKRSSILRRISRRMNVNHVHTLSEYLGRFEDKPEELDELFKDLLISVTNFFRDPSAFETLEKDIVPKLFEGKKFDDQVRVWTVGCATGEEAYSLAILLYEYAQKLEYSPEIKVFATDIDEEALRFGREGFFPESIAAELTPDRLEQYFIKDGSHYHIKQEIKDMVLFTPHDLLRDPPFLKLDLLVCRNLLIYLKKDLQAEVFKLIHYALNPGKFLFLGMSGSNFEAAELFTPINKDFRIYQRKESSTPNFYLPERPLRLSRTHLSPSRFNTRFSQKKSDIKALHHALLLKKYAPQSVILNENHEVVHSTDGIQQFLEYSGGEPSRNILEMIKPELYPALRSMLFQAGNEETEETQIIMKTQGSLEDGKIRIELERYPIQEKDFPDGLFQIVFKKADIVREQYLAKEKDDNRNLSGEASGLIEALENELEYTRQKLQLSLDETETSNEKLRASNEELQSMNEELHSTTEELETSLEELQSVNEELKLANQKLESKVDELQKANSDLKNLMESIEIGLLFVDRDLCVQRFTSGTSKIFNLISSDIGRPIDHITHQLEYDSLRKDLEYVLETREKIKKTIYARSGHWYIMRQHPYRSVKGDIEGVVITFVESIEIREARKELQRQKQNETLATLGIYALEQYDLENIIHRAVQLLCMILEADFVLVFSRDHDNKNFILQESTGLAKDKEYETVIDDKGKWDISFALGTDEPLVVSDYRDEDRFLIVPILEDVNIKSGLSLQIMGSSEVYGIMGIYTVEKRDFSDQDLHFAQIVATILGLSMERIEARNRLEETNEQLQQEIQKSNQYQREILHNSVTERWEIGGYLHDNLAQLLASTKIMLNDISKHLPGGETDIPEDLEELMKAIDDEINNIRDLTHEIIPVNIEDEGAEQAFRFLMRNTQKLHKVNCELKAGDIFDKITDRKLATNLYHVVQEAIRNAVTHGKAENIEIFAEEEEGNLFVEIKDDGTGIGEMPKDHLGKGLRIMHHRIEILNGNINIQNRHEPGQTGTVITCILPLEG